MPEKIIHRGTFLSIVVILGFSLTFSMCASAPDQPGPPVDAYGDLASRLGDFVSSFGIAGLAVGIVSGGRIAYAEGFGYESAETLEPVTANTLFHAASISKTFVATAVMQLVEQGLVDIGDPLTDYIPLFTMADEGYRGITIKQMLTHTSGMPDVRDYEWEAPRYDEYALENYVLSLYSEHLLAEPGSGWAYSNLAFDCLGNVIANVSGLSFEEYEAQHVLGPSYMPASTFLKPAALPAGWASPHRTYMTPRVRDVYPYNRIHAPSSTLHTSVVELCNWAITNLNHGNFGGTSILQDSTYENLWGNHYAIPDGRGLFHNGGHQGLAWAVGTYGGETIVGHSGSDEGFVSNLILVPDKSVAVAILCNIDSPYLQELTCLVLDAALGLPAAELHPPAGVAALRTLEASGLEAAVAMWDSLKTASPDGYDFSSTWTFRVGESILEMGTPAEAELFARFYGRTMSADVVEEAVDLLRAFLLQNPGHENAEIMLAILSG
jgi:CubicO group peptidase (beta-lactamase class C family)